MNKLVDIYGIVTGIFSTATQAITEGLNQGAQSVFNNEFFNTAFALSLVYIGFLIAFRKIQNEELAQRLIWTLIIFSLVKLILFDNNTYRMVIDFLNVPRDIFTELIYDLTKNINEKATLKNIINSVSTSIDSLATTILSKAGWNNVSAYFYGAIIYISGLFLVFVILLNSVFSIFLSNVIMALMPFVLIFLVWNKLVGGLNNSVSRVD